MAKGDFKMKDIRFLHDYIKLGNFILPLECTLVQVLKAKREELSEIFVAYDTEYYFGRNQEHLGKFKLPEGEIIILLLKPVLSSYIITTIRSFTPDKFEYYKGLEGQDVRLVKSKPGW